MIQSKLITGIMACDENGLIGKGSGLPDWRCPDDMKHFRRTTKGHVMIMGEATYDCLPPKLLRNRKSIVLSHKVQEPTVHAVFIDAIAKLPELLGNMNGEQKIFLIGGANLALQFFQQNLIDRFILSEIAGAYDGDCYFAPEFLTGLRQWPVETSEACNGFIIRTYGNPDAANLV